MGLAPQRVAVRHLRVRDGRADAVAARLRTERALAGVELHPRSLPPGAILLVRSLRARVGDAQEALAELLRTAAHPAREAVPAAARAVVFAGRAELLACLATDWCAGVVPGRWWWSSVLPHDERGPVGAWEDAPEAVPASLSILATAGRAVEFVRRIDDPTAHRIARAVAHVHGVPPADDLRPARPGPASPPGQARATPNAEPAPPRSDPAPEASAPGLSSPQRSLLRLGLTLARAPGDLHAAPPRPGTPPRFEAATTRAPQRPAPPAARTPIAPTPITSSPIAQTPIAGPSRVTAPPAAPVDAHAPDGPAVTPTPSARAVEPPGRAGEAAAAAHAEPAAAEAPSTTAPAGEHADAPEAPTAPAPTERAPTERATAGPSAPVPLAQSDTQTPWESLQLPWLRPVETEIGGLLFVICVAQRLGLYADFTEPAAPGLAIDPWRFVALVGTQLLDRDEHEDDPLWTLLDELARGGGDELPPRELSTHAAAIRDWIESRVDLPLRAVLERPALVHVDDLRLDAVFSLGEHPIEIRIAGLDIDPGWIPAAGRALHFHFE